MDPRDKKNVHNLIASTLISAKTPDCRLLCFTDGMWGTENPGVSIA